MENLLRQIDTVNNEAYQIKMYYLTKTKRSTGNEYLAYGVPIAADIRSEIKELIIDGVVSKLQDKTLAEFDTTYTETGTIQFLDTAQVNNYNNITEAVSTVLTESLEELDFSKIWGYCISIVYDREERKEALFFKKFTYPKVMRNGIRLKLSNGSYDKLDERIITIDNDVHSFSVNSVMYVLNKSSFESFFNFSTAYQYKVQSSIDTLQELDVVNNLDGFVQHCLTSDTLTRRLVKIINEEKFERLQSFISRVPAVIQEFTLDVNFDASTNKIIYDENSNVSDIITLIKGACVKGALDNEPYIAVDTKSITRQ